jgi:hypothetical protein
MAQSITLSSLNDVLKNLESVLNTKPISEESESYEDSYGESSGGSVHKIYKTSLPDIYLRVTSYEDSYGDSGSIRGLEFVKEKKKTVTEFETI